MDNTHIGTHQKPFNSHLVQQKSDPSLSQCNQKGRSDYLYVQSSEQLGTTRSTEHRRTPPCLQQDP